MTASVNDRGDEASLPGFRFHPTDEELVGFYLRRKVEKKPIRLDLIRHIDIYNHDPWDLPKGGGVEEKEWYFFCRRGRKYKNSVRPNRVTGSGFWKATGIDKPIYSIGEPRECIGLKKSLVYYRGSAGKGNKTDWMMHEFRLPPIKSTDLSNTNKTCQEAEVWTICRILKREISYKQHAPERPKTCSRQSLTDSRSITSSSMSNNKDICPHFGAFAAVEVENKSFSDHIDERNQLLAGQLGLTGQVPYMTSCFSNSSSNGDEFFQQPNWDELMQVVDFAVKPLQPHLCWQVEH